MKKIRIRRRAYTRKGKRIKGTTYYAKDLGAPGRTPKAKRFSKFKHKLGWKKTQSAGTRWNVLKKAKGKIGKLKTLKAMLQVANVTTDRETKKKMRGDIKKYRRAFYPHRF